MAEIRILYAVKCLMCDGQGFSYSIQRVRLRCNECHGSGRITRHRTLAPNCPTCGGDLLLDKGEQELRCLACGRSPVEQGFIQQAVRVGNL